MRRAFRAGAVIGFIPRGGPGAGRPVVNPKDSVRVPAGADLVFVAASARVERADAAQAAEAAPPARLRRCRKGPWRRRHVAVLCFDKEPAPMLEALAEFAPRGSRVTLIVE